MLAPPDSFCTAKAAPKKISVQVITLFALSRLTAMETQQSKERKNHETQKFTPFATQVDCHDIMATRHFRYHRVDVPGAFIDDPSRLSKRL